jgi:hypothetical protein
MRPACGRKHRANISENSKKKYGWLWHHSLAADLEGFQAKIPQKSRD